MEILEKVKSILPAEAISRIELEGSEIIVYTKDREFFLTYEDVVRKAVEQLKKRIEIRPESNLTTDQEETKKKIKEIVPEDAKIKDIYFEPERSLVIIAAEKPGLVIGKGGETFRKIRSETFWVPRIERVPSIKSEIIEGIRKVLHTEVKFRKEFLNKIGESIFTERKTNRDWIRLIALGGFREVGRSCILVETPKSKVLIDCGVNVGGADSNIFPYFQTKEFDYNELDAIIVSHSHLDHLGLVPMFFEHGYNGPVYMTTPTVDLATLLWLDYIDVMQRNAVNPIFTAKGVKEAVKHSIPLEYGEVSDVAPDVRLTFQNAGHILGSSLIHLHIGEGLHNIVYASDMKFGRTTLLEPAFTDFQRVETLILESTYGAADDVMPPRQEAEKQLMEVINKTMERKGIVLIPSFAVERAQDVMAILVENNFQYPVFIDGMIWDATGIYTAYPEYMNRTIQRKIFNNQDPFLSDIFKRVASPADREKVWEEKPCVIISTSGMLVGGPAIEHLKALAENPENTLIFVGYQCVKDDTQIISKDGSIEIGKIFKSGKELIKTNNIELRSINNNLLSLDLNLRELQEGFSNICSRRFYEGDILRIETEDGNEVFLSPNHPVLTKNYIWKLAKNLTQNDEVWVLKSIRCFKMNLKLIKIKKIERIPFRGYLYDITSNPHHNFIANNILIHNSEGTMGRRIQKGWKEIPFRSENGKMSSINLNMEIQTIDGLSGHSDHNQLLSFVRHLTAKPDKIIICHGENQKAVNLARTIHRLFRIETVAPKNLESLRLK